MDKTKSRDTAVSYIDRLNDKIFNYNNLLIGGFFALGQINNDVPNWTIIFPLFNSALLIFFDFKLMMFNTNEATSKEEDNLDKNINHINHAFWSSLLSILSTLVITAVFVWFLI